MQHFEPMFFRVRLKCSLRLLKLMKASKDNHLYFTVIGASPSYIQQGFVIQESSFYKSEYEFGSYWNRFPLIVVSMSVAKELVKQKFKGLYFKDVLISDVTQPLKSLSLS